MTDLVELPNNGPPLAGDLRATGIDSGAGLRQLGAVAAWERIRRVNRERDCASSLLALEGAVRGLRWTTIDRAKRRRLSQHAESRRRAQ